MFLFVDPDELKRTSKGVYPNNAEVCPGLEAVTGADFCIGQFPISPVDSLSLHIDNRSLFVQRKSGYDICSFENLHHSIARMKAANIPYQQAILLPIGNYYPDDNGLLRLKGEKPYQNVTYETFEVLLAMWELRGGKVDLTVKSDDMLPGWIESRQRILEKVREENDRLIFSRGMRPFLDKDGQIVVESDDMWQELSEAPKDHWSSFLCAGLDGFGEKKAKAVQEYIQSQLPHLWESGYHVLLVLTEEDEWGKPIHEIPGWGSKSRKKLRGLMGLPPGYNLDVRETLMKDFVSGWKSFGESFKEQMDRQKDLPKEDRISASTIWQALMKEANQFYDE